MSSLSPASGLKEQPQGSPRTSGTSGDASSKKRSEPSTTTTSSQKIPSADPVDPPSTPRDTQNWPSKRPKLMGGTSPSFSQRSATPNNPEIGDIRAKALVAELKRQYFSSRKLDGPLPIPPFNFSKNTYEDGDGKDSRSDKDTEDDSSDAMSSSAALKGPPPVISSFKVVEILSHKGKTIDSDSPGFVRIFDNILNDPTGSATGSSSSQASVSDKKRKGASQKAASATNDLISVPAILNTISQQIKANANGGGGNSDDDEDFNNGEDKDGSNDDDDEDDDEEDDEFFSYDPKVDMGHDALLEYMEKQLNNGSAIGQATLRVEVSPDLAREIKMYLWMNGPYAFIQKFVNSPLSKATLGEILAALSFPLPEHLVTRSRAELLTNLVILAVQYTVMPRKRLPVDLTFDSLVDIIDKARNIIVLTGAGISTSLGIPDFRSKSGLYNKLAYLGLSDPQEVFDLSIFRQDPSIFYSIAKEILPVTTRFSPTHAFIKLLQDKGKLLRNYTQNIDNLEHYAGIRADRLVQCHGSFATATCQTCGYRTKGENLFEDIRNQIVSRCPRCKAAAEVSLAAEQRTNGSAGSTKKQKKNGKNKNSSSTWVEGSGDTDDDDDDFDVSTVHDGADGSSFSGLNIGNKNYGILDPRNTSSLKYDPFPLKSSSSSSSSADSATADNRSAARSASQDPGSTSNSSASNGYGIAINVVPSMRKNPNFGVMKPDITFFGEPLPHTFEDTLIGGDADRCDLLLCIGTSLKVSPVSETVRIVPPSVVQVYVSKTMITHNEFDLTLLGACDDVVEHLCNRLFWKLDHPMVANIDFAPYIEYKPEIATYEIHPRPEVPPQVDAPASGSSAPATAPSTSSNGSATADKPQSDNTASAKDDDRPIKIKQEKPSSGSNGATVYTQKSIDSYFSSARQ